MTIQEIKIMSGGGNHGPRHDKLSRTIKGHPRPGQLTPPGKCLDCGRPTVFAYCDLCVISPAAFWPESRNPDTSGPARRNGLVIHSFDQISGERRE